MKGETDELRQPARQWSRLLAAATATAAVVAPGAMILEAAHSAAAATAASRTSQTQPTLTAGDQGLVQAICIHHACADW